MTTQSVLDDNSSGFIPPLTDEEMAAMPAPPKRKRAMASKRLSEASPIISDPLAWQAAIDDAPAGINMRGSLRFWMTVEALSGMEVVYRDGAPEFSEIVFRLRSNIGLRLYAGSVNRFEFDADDTEITPFIRFEFCEIVEEGK